MSGHIPGWRTKCSHSNIMPRHARNSTPVYRIYNKRGQREWTMAPKHKFQHEQVGGPLVFWLQESSRQRDRGVHREICDLGGARVAQLWEHSPPTSVTRVRILASTPHVGWVCCWFSPLLREVFLRVLSLPLKASISKFQFKLERTDTFQRVLKNYIILSNMTYVNKRARWVQQGYVFVSVLFEKSHFCLKWS